MSRFNDLFTEKQCGLFATRVLCSGSSDWFLFFILIVTIFQPFLEFKYVHVISINVFLCV